MRRQKFTQEQSGAPHKKDDTVFAKITMPMRSTVFVGMLFLRRSMSSRLKFCRLSSYATKKIASRFTVTSKSSPLRVSNKWIRWLLSDSLWLYTRYS